MYVLEVNPRASRTVPFVSKASGVPWAKIAAKVMVGIKLADIEPFRNRLTKTLSGGWKQRLALGCAIIHEPRIIFLDEPTSGVDPITRSNFWAL